MEFPAISNSNPHNFPLNSHRKPKPNSPKSHLPINLRCKPDHQTVSSSTTATKKKKKFSIPTRCTNQTNQCPPIRRENQKEKQWIHFVGIGGCGLSSLAKLALRQGFEVSGSDIAWSRYMEGLQEDGAKLYLTHSVSNIERNKGLALPDTIVVSSAIPEDNVEVLHAKALGVPVYKRDYWLEKATEHYKLIAVSGTHGKSTTASMLAYVLRSMGDDLTAVIGAHVPQFPGGNILCGCSQTFVLEADEYDGCFLRLSPSIAVVTNAEWEHVDIFQDEDTMKRSFRKFLKRIRVGGHLILCGDSEGACTLLNHRKMATITDHMPLAWSSQHLEAGYKITTYGISNSNEWHASSIRPNLQGGSSYVLYHMDCAVADISLQVPGVHNVVNSLAVIATVRALINKQRPTHELVSCMKSHLNNFIGVSRRFEMIGQICGCHIYDDYAHHPTEVRAVFQAARQTFPLKALWVVFQPHTYSRLATFMNDFAVALSGADRVVVTAVYAAREMNIWNVGGRDLAKAIIGPPSEYIPFLGDVVTKLVVETSINPHKEILILTLGAGNITTVGPKLLKELQQILRYTT